MTSCQYRKSHCGDKTILRPSYLHNGISKTGKMTSLYWIWALGLISEMICSPPAQIRSYDPDRPIAFHKHWSWSAHQTQKMRNQTVYCQSNLDINYSLGNLELKLLDRGWTKNARLMMSIHDSTMGGVANIIYVCQYETIMASSVHSQYNMVWTCHVWQICVCD